MNFSDGSTYEGDWKKDKMHGKGRIKYHDGEIYDGGWFINEKHGYGFTFKEKPCDAYSVKYDTGKELMRQKLNQADN